MQRLSPDGNEIMKTSARCKNSVHGNHIMGRLSPYGCRNERQVDKKTQLLSEHNVYDVQDYEEGANNFTSTL